jgi:propionate CoA-transferase
VYVTERAVFELTKDGLMLTEVAPGIDLEKDILPNMEFRPIISSEMKLMPAGIFKPVWGELKQVLVG